MSKKTSQILQFIFNCFLVAVLVNSIVAAAQIFHDKDFAFSQEVQIFLLSAGASAVVFAGVCVLLYLICLIAGTGSEKIFWLLMTIAIITATIVGILFKNEFRQYTEKPGYFAAISAFSIMVSLAAQYQFFHKNDVSVQPLN